MRKDTQHDVTKLNDIRHITEHRNAQHNDTHIKTVHFDTQNNIYVEFVILVSFC
jgi:hypothetical protein